MIVKGEAHTIPVDVAGEERDGLMGNDKHTGQTKVNSVPGIHFWDLRRRLPGGISAVLVLVVIVALAGCSELTPTGTPTPTPTPTLTPTPIPLVAFGVGSMPMPDAVKLARLSHLLSPVPAQYAQAIHLDLAALRENPDIEEAIQLDQLGVLSALPPGADDLLDGLMVASREEGEGLIVIMDGTLDVEGLFQVAQAFGISLGGPKPESYRDHQIWDIDLLGLKLAIGGVDGSTSVSSTGSTTGGGSAIDLVKGALDSFDGLGPQVMDDPNVARLVNRLPSGFVTTLFLSCAGMENISPISSLEGCAGAAASVELLSPETLAVNILVGFSIEGQASIAAALVEKRGISLGRLVPQDMAAGLEGPLLAVRLLIDTAQVAQVIDALIAQQ